MVPPVRQVPTDALRPAELAALRGLFDAAWADDPEAFTEEDWEHTVGGVHFVVEDAGAIISHASVVQRELHVADRPLVTGYVEAVATAPARRRWGLASAVMAAVNAHIDAAFELGALGTGIGGFYERLGWVMWRGPTSVRAAEGLERTPEEDGQVFVRLTPPTAQLDITAPISCEWRPGDVW